MAHLFIMKSVPTAPLWLQVGLGRYLQKYRIHYRGNFWLACFGSPVFDEPAWPGMSAGPADTRARVPGAPVTAAGSRCRRRGAVGRLVRTTMGGTAAGTNTRPTAWSTTSSTGRTACTGAASRCCSTPSGPARAAPRRSPSPTPTSCPRSGTSASRPTSGPPRSRALIAATPDISQGLCFQIPPAHHADKKPRREKANERDIHVLMTDLQQVDPFRRHSGWWPQDIVEAEASKRKRQPGPRRARRPGARGPSAGARRGPRGEPPEAAGPAIPGPPDEGEIPTIRVPGRPSPEPASRASGQADQRGLDPGDGRLHLRQAGPVLLDRPRAWRGRRTPGWTACGCRTRGPPSAGRAPSAAWPARPRPRRRWRSRMQRHLDLAGHGRGHRAVRRLAAAADGDLRAARLLGDQAPGTPRG